jgi:hypothetical protein
MFHRLKEDSNYKTPSEQVYFLGGSGTFYLANSLDKRVLDNEAIHKIVPGRGSDVWFWVAAVANDTKQVCLGSKTDINLYFSVPTTKQTRPKDTSSPDIMEKRFQLTIDYFGIREKLLAILPD